MSSGPRSDAAAPASTQPPRPPLWRRLLPLVGVALVAAFLARLDLRAMVDVLARADPLWVCAAALAFAVNVFGKALRWQRLVVARGYPLALGEATWLFLEAAFFGSLTFGRLGEFIRVGRLHDRGVPPAVGLASCLVDRGLDLAALLLVGGAALVGLTSSIAAGVAAFALGTAALAIGSFVARRIAASAPAEPTTGRLRARTRALVVGTAQFLVPRTFAEAMLWTALSWLPAFSMVWMLARAFAIEASWLSLTAAQAISSLSGLLPITYQGVGTREPIFAAVLAREGIASERAVVLALATFVVMFLVVVGLGLVELATRRARKPRS